MVILYSPKDVNPRILNCLKLPLTLYFFVEKLSFKPSVFNFKASLLSSGCLRFEIKVKFMLKYSIGVMLFSSKLQRSKIEVSVIFSASNLAGLDGKVSEK